MSETRVVKAGNVVGKVNGTKYDLFKGDEIPGDFPKGEVGRLDELGALEPLEDEPTLDVEPEPEPGGVAEDDLATWVAFSTVDDIVAAVRAEPALRDRVLAAENARDKPRKSLVAQVAPPA